MHAARVRSVTRRLRTVENFVIGWSLRKRSPEDKVKFGKWQRMAASEPSLIAGVISPKHRARVPSIDQAPAVNVE